MEPSKAQVLLAKLREEIRRRESPGAAERPVLASGFSPLDGLLPGGGFPAGRVVELTGSSASGKTTLALLAIAQATRAGRLAAFVDSSGELYPPAARALGADLTRLLVVRPRQGDQAVRAAALLARSKAFAVVVADVASLAGPAGPASRRLLEAAETGRAALVLLTVAPSGLDCSLRLLVERGEEAELTLRVERNRMGPPGRAARGRLPTPEELGKAAPRLLLVPGPEVSDGAQP